MIPGLAREDHNHVLVRVDRDQLTAIPGGKKRFHPFQQDGLLLTPPLIPVLHPRGNLGMSLRRYSDPFRVEDLNTIPLALVEHQLPDLGHIPGA